MSNNKNFYDERVAHTGIKLRIYEEYLGRYLSILAATNKVKRVFIVDLFCGPGTYQDGNEGSPLIAVNAIDKVLTARPKLVEQSNIEFFLQLNDGDENHVKSLQSTLDQRLQSPASIKIKLTSLSYQKRIQEILSGVSKMNPEERAFLFIDPFGYSKISREHFVELLKSKKFEILLFLPISFMHRFAKADIDRRTEDDPSIRPLMQFTEDFEHEPGFLRDAATAEEYMLRLNEAFRESIHRELHMPVYTCCFDLKNEKNPNHYALFHISIQELAKQKMLEVLWSIDELNGRGFDAKAYELRKLPTLPGADFRPLKRYERELEGQILRRLQQGEASNDDLCEIALDCDCLESHLKIILKKLEKEQKIAVEATDGLKRKTGTYAAIDSKKRSFVVRLIENPSTP